MADSFLERFKTRAKQENSEDWETQEATVGAEDEDKKPQDSGDQSIRQASREGGTRIRAEPSVTGSTRQDNAGTCEGAGGEHGSPGLKRRGCTGVGMEDAAADGAFASERKKSGKTASDYDHDAIGQDFVFLDMQESSLLGEFMQHFDRYFLRPAADDLEPLADSSEDVNKYGIDKRPETVSERIPQSLVYEGKRSGISGGGSHDLAFKPSAQTLEGMASSAVPEDTVATSGRFVGDNDAKLWHCSSVFTKNVENANLFQDNVPSEETQQHLTGKDVLTNDTVNHASHLVPVERIIAKTSDTDGQSTSALTLPPPLPSSGVTLDSSSPLQRPPCTSQSSCEMSMLLPPLLALPEERRLRPSSDLSPLNPATPSDSNISPASGQEEEDNQEFIFTDVADGGHLINHHFDDVERSSSPLDFTIQKQRASLGKSGVLGNRKPGKPRPAAIDPEWMYRDSTDSPSAQLPVEEPATQKRGFPGAFRLPALGPSLPGAQLKKKAQNDGDDGELSAKLQTKKLFKSKSSLGLPLPGARKLLPATASDNADIPGSEPPQWLKELKTKKKPVKEYTQM